MAASSGPDQVDLFGPMVDTPDLQMSSLCASSVGAERSPFERKIKRKSVFVCPQPDNILYSSYDFVKCGPIATKLDIKGQGQGHQNG